MLELTKSVFLWCLIMLDNDKRLPDLIKTYLQANRSKYKNVEAMLDS